MTDQVSEEAAPDVTSDGPAETTDLMTEALEATETQASPEQTETADATDSESQGEQASAPESYEFTAPEGVTLNKDSAAIAAFSEHAKSLNLTQEQAQEQFSRLDAAVRADQAKQNAAQLEAWAKETREDPEFGGLQLQANMVKVSQFAKTFGDDALGDLLKSGLANNLPLVRAMAKAVDAISPDKFVAGNAAEGRGERTAADFFGDPDLK